MICKCYIPFADADKLKAQNITHFYNSITLLGEFYHRLNKKSQPVGVVGRSLFDLLAKEVRNVTINCTNDPAYTFEVEFARLLLTQVSKHNIVNIHQQYI